MSERTAEPSRPRPPPIAATALTWRRLAIVIGALAAALIIATLNITDAPPRALAALGLAGFTVVMWATAAIPPPIAALLFMIVAGVTGLVEPTTVAQGFTSNAVWLVFGGLLIGASAEKSGFGRWIARRFLAPFQGSYSKLVLGILIGTSVLAFLVPANMGRIAITVPIVMALAREVGYAPGSQGYIGLMIAAVLGNFTVALGILPANLLNIMIVGTAEAMYGITFTYMQYLVLCLPVLGIAKGLLVWRLIPIVYPSPEPQATPASATQAGVLSADGVRIALILACAILLWATDFLHGIRPGYVAIGAGLVCAAPRIGILTFGEIFERRRMELLVWIAGVIVLSDVLSETGASALLSRWLTTLAAAEGKSPLYGYFAIAYLTSFMTNFATMGGTVPTMTAVVGGVSNATGLPLEIGVLAISAGCSALWLPYVAAPMVVGLSIANVSLAHAARFTIASSILTAVIIIPANVLWWRMLGVMP